METTTQTPPPATISQVYSYPGYHAEVVGRKNMPPWEVIQRIINQVALAYKTTPEIIKGKSRKREVVIPRHVSQFFAVTLTDISLAGIATCYSNRDHSTVVHAVAEVKNALAIDVHYRQQLIQLHQDLVKMIPVAQNNGRPSFHTVLEEAAKSKNYRTTPIDYTND